MIYLQGLISFQHLVSYPPANLTRCKFWSSSSLRKNEAKHKKLYFNESKICKIRKYAENYWKFELKGSWNGSLFGCNSHSSNLIFVEEIICISDVTSATFSLMSRKYKFNTNTLSDKISADKIFGGQKFSADKIFGIKSDFRQLCPPKFCPIRYKTILVTV